MNGLKIGMSVIVGLVLLSLALSSFVVVDAGYVGVVKRLGAVQSEYLPEGFHLKVPFLDVVQDFDVRLSKAESDAGASSRGHDHRINMYPQPNKRGRPTYPTEKRGECYELDTIHSRSRSL